LTYGGERPDLRALDQLESVVRELAEDLTNWRARALKAEDGKGATGGGRSGRGSADAEARAAIVGLEADNRALRQRLDGARARLADLLARLSFLEEQTRATGTEGGR
jgi:hypothetical protein